MSRKKKRIVFFGIAMLLFGAACATVGKEFPVKMVPEIRIGETTRAEVREMFGPPWRTGLEDGMPTWTFARYRYSLFGDEETEDLVVRFDANWVVTSYTFNTTEHDE